MSNDYDLDANLASPSRGDSKVKTEWHALAALMGISFVIGMLAASHISAESLLSAIVVLLFSVLILLWRLYKLLCGLANKLGFNPARAERINALFRKLDDPIWFSSSKLTDAEREKIHKELEELTDSDWNQEPVKSGQMVRIIEHLRDITALLVAQELPLREDRETETDWARTGQLARIIEQLEHMSGLLARLQNP